MIVIECPCRIVSGLRVPLKCLQQPYDVDPPAIVLQLRKLSLESRGQNAAKR